MTGKKENNKEKECFICKKTDFQAVLLYCRKNGEDLLVCTRCLPMLIHGG
jgi:PP-loop superfamily ATP-utilizing enzyme